MARNSGWLLLLCACGSVASEKQDAAPAVDSKVIDAAPDTTGPRCDPTKAFANLAPLANVNSASSELWGRMSADELTLYFGSNRAGGAGGYDIYTATRSSTTADFGSPTQVASLATAGDDRSPMPTANGLGMYFSRSPAGQPTVTDFYLATRTSTSTDFTQSALVPELNSGSEETELYLTEGENVMYFVSTRTPSQSYDIWRATKQTNGVWGQLEIVTAASGASIEGFPIGSEDGKALYFGSNRTGGSLWQVTRPTAGGSFGAASVVTELETSDDEAPGWLSKDGCVIVFHRNGTGLGQYDLWMAKRPL
ncbi:MAG TPA: hypothetical protein VMZ53_18115 [Kofleriaceae bacterium]|nr:hypothetical protein [Kofleriaceae bacterium]